MKRLFILLMVGILIPTKASSQEFKKVVEIVRQMEADLKTMIESERKQREADFGSLRVELRAIVNPVKQVWNGRGETGPRVTAVAPAATATFVSRLQEGNDRFVRGKTSAKDFVGQRAELTKDQHPYAIIISCSDSRVVPEILFDEALGQLFVVRTAGNVVDSVVLGSVEYAAEHLHARLLIVLGHEECGAVKATIAGGESSPNIGALVRRVRPAVEQTRAKQPAESLLLRNAIEENVRQQMSWILSQSGVLQGLVSKGGLTISGAVYSLATGAVRFLDGSRDREANVDAVARSVTSGSTLKGERYGH